MSYWTLGHQDIRTLGHWDFWTSGHWDLRMQVPGKRPFDTSAAADYSGTALTQKNIHLVRYLSPPRRIEGRTHRNSIITETLIRIEARRNFCHLHAP